MKADHLHTSSPGFNFHTKIITIAPQKLSITTCIITRRTDSDHKTVSDNGSHPYKEFKARYDLQNTLCRVRKGETHKETINDEGQFFFFPFLFFFFHGYTK